MEELKGFLFQLIASAVFSAIAVAVLAWLARSWISERLKNAIKHEYDEKLETHKAQLKAQGDVEIEKLRSGLMSAAQERHVKLAKLHEHRAEVIAETYRKLMSVHIQLGEYVKIFEPANGKSRDERRKDVEVAHREFLDYYPAKRIFLPRSAVEKIDKLNDMVVKSFYDFHYGVEAAQIHTTDVRTRWLGVFTRVKDEIGAALSDLEDEFRRLLGDES